MKAGCDKCHSKIISGKCDCGEWREHGRKGYIADTLEKAILAFNELNIEHIGGDHFSGTSFVFFKGDYEMCQKVKQFVQKEQGDIK